MRAPLTELSVRALKPNRGRQVKVWDATTPGFGVRVNGRSKSWIVMFGRRRSLKVLGKCSDMPLAKARAEAKKILANYTDHPPTPTFGDALDRYYALHVSKLRPSTRYALKGVLERHFRVWENKELGDITPHHIVQTLDGLLDTPAEAHHAWKELRAFYRWCVGRYYLAHSPSEGLKAPTKTKPRERVLTDQELARVWHAAEQTRPHFGIICRLLILTGQRRGEIAKLRGEYVNRKEQTITLPSHLTKNGREHTFPYGDMLASILPDTDHGWLFPARGRPQTPFNGFAACKSKLDIKCQVDFDIHDLRRTFSTTLARLGVAPHVIERLLNHVRGQISPIAAVYNRYSYLPEMREAIAKWEAHLSSLFNQN